MSENKSGGCGCGALLVIVLFLLAPPFWHFVKASWPTWGFLILAIVLLLIARHYEENLLFKATKKVLVPITAGLTTLMALELLFSLCTYFTPDRVQSFQGTILDVHFAIERFESRLGYVIPLSVTFAVAFLCLTVGNWKYSAALAKIREVFRFVSVFILILSSFSFFRHHGVDTILEDDRAQTVGVYEMEIADEEKAIAQGMAARELKETLTDLDEESKKNFAAFFEGLNDACKIRECYGYSAYLGRNASWEALMTTIHEKAQADYQHFNPVDIDVIREEKLRQKLPAELQTRWSAGYFSLNRSISHFGKTDVADVPLDSSHDAAEVQLTKRATSESDLYRNQETGNKQAGRVNTMEKWAEEERKETTEAFAAALASLVPDIGERMVAEYVKELTDAIAEWVVRPTVDFMFKQGFRGNSIEELHLVQDKVSSEVHQSFGSFRPQFTQNHVFESRQDVARRFSDEELHRKEEIKRQEAEFKRIEERERERRVE